MTAGEERWLLCQRSGGPSLMAACWERPELPPHPPLLAPYHRCIAAISPSLKVKGRDLRLSLRTLVRPVTIMLPTRRETLGCSCAARLLCSDFAIVGLRSNEQAVFMRTPQVEGSLLRICCEERCWCFVKGYSWSDCSHHENEKLHERVKHNLKWFVTKVRSVKLSEELCERGISAHCLQSGGVQSANGRVC